MFLIVTSLHRTKKNPKNKTKQSASNKKLYLFMIPCLIQYFILTEDDMRKTKTTSLTPPPSPRLIFLEVYLACSLKMRC